MKILKTVYNTIKFILLRDKLTLNLLTGVILLQIFINKFSSFQELINQIVSFLNSITVFLGGLNNWIDSLLNSIIGSLLFYLIGTGLQERAELKNSFSYLIFEYRLMRADIIRVMLIAINEGLSRVDDSVVDKLASNSSAAQKYFSQEIFNKAINGMDEKSMLEILRSIQQFIEVLKPLHQKYIKNGDQSLLELFSTFRDIEKQVELFVLDKQGKGLWLAVDWVDDLSPKSIHPLYQLICLTVDGIDTRLRILRNELEKYS